MARLRATLVISRAGDEYCLREDNGHSMSLEGHGRETRKTSVMVAMDRTQRETKKLLQKVATAPECRSKSMEV
jgi:hypothetical protein